MFQICSLVVQNFGNCASGSKLLLKCRNKTGSNWLLQGPGDILFCFNFLKRSLIWKSGNCLCILFQNVFLQLALYCWRYSIVFGRVYTIFWPLNSYLHKTILSLLTIFVLLKTVSIDFYSDWKVLFVFVPENPITM